KRFARVHAQADQRYVAAPVFGRPAMAAGGKLFIVVAGDPATVEACQALFRAMGQKAIVIGTEPAAANLVKLSGNFLTAAAIEAMGEAIALVGKAGIDRQAYMELLTATVFNAAPYTTYGPLIAQGKFEPAAFAAPLAYKDIRLALAAAERLRVPMPLGRRLRGPAGCASRGEASCSIVCRACWLLATSTSIGRRPADWRLRSPVTAHR